MSGIGGATQFLGGLQFHPVHPVLAGKHAEDDVEEEQGAARHLSDSVWLDAKSACRKPAVCQSRFDECVRESDGHWEWRLSAAMREPSA
jgi:hypothetical protein